MKDSHAGLCLLSVSNHSLAAQHERPVPPCKSSGHWALTVAVSKPPGGGTNTCSGARAASRLKPVPAPSRAGPERHGSCTTPPFRTTIVRAPHGRHAPTCARSTLSGREGSGRTSTCTVRDAPNTDSCVQKVAEAVPRNGSCAAVKERKMYSRKMCSGWDTNPHALGGIPSALLFKLPGHVWVESVRDGAASF